MATGGVIRLVPPCPAGVVAGGIAAWRARGSTQKKKIVAYLVARPTRARRRARGSTHAESAFVHTRANRRRMWLAHANADAETRGVLVR